MKSFIIKSLEVILLISFVITVIGFGIVFPFVGIIPGIAVGAMITGMGFTLISINENLVEIRILLGKQAIK